MAGRLFIRIAEDKKLLFMGPADKSGEIRLRLRHKGQHRGYFQLLLEDRGGGSILILKEEIIIPGPEAGQDLTFRVFRQKGRRLLLEILDNDTIIHNREVNLPPRKIPFLPAAGLIPLLFLFLPLLPGRWTEDSGTALPEVLPPSLTVDQGPAEPAPPPAATPTREVVITDGAFEMLPPDPPENKEPENPPVKEQNAAPGFPERQGVLFLPDSPELTALARERLNLIPLREGEKTLTLLQVRGHCALWGTEAGRQKLSVERAEAVAGYLVRRGARVLQETIIEGLGATEPLTRDPDNQEINRRVEIVLTYR